MASPNIRTTQEIPKVESRSKALITITGVIGGYDPLTQNLADVLGGAQFIGNVSKITLPNKRGMQDRRELNAANFGEIMEIVPGLVDFEGMRWTNVITYQQDFLQACGFQGGLSTDYQSYPMLFILTLPAPNPFLTRTLLINKAWIVNNPYEFSVEDKDDLRITQEIDIRCASIQPFNI